MAILATVLAATFTPLEELPKKLDEGYTVIALVRHGETDFNAAKKAQGGMSDVPLNAEGHLQAEKLAEHIATKISPYLSKRLYAAHLLRTFETASPIAERLHLEIITDPDLRERDLGEAEGVPNSNKAIREALDAFITDKSDASWCDDSTYEAAGIAGAETPSAVSARMKSALEKIGDENPSKLVYVITSGKAVRIAVATLANNIPEREVPPALENGETIYLLYKKDPEGKKSFTYWARETLEGKITPILS